MGIRRTATCQGENCENPVLWTPGNPRKYCSYGCYHRAIAGKPSPKHAAKLRPPREPVQCTSCSKEFQPQGWRPRRYCSVDCYNKDRLLRVTKTCGFCTCVFKGTATAQYCSLHCANSVKAEENKNQRAVLCPTCGVRFSRKASTNPIHCSHYCACKARWKEQHVAGTCLECGCSFGFLKGDPRTFCSTACFVTNRGRGKKVTSQCPICAKEFIHYRIYERMCCSWHCLKVYKSLYVGEYHPRWRGGADAYRGANWDEQRQKARERDRFCVDCGTSPEELGIALSVHHIIPFRVFGDLRYLEANNLSNLVCLCPTCHGLREAECLRRY